MEYGQIFHVMRIGKYYCKNMKYRISIGYTIARRVGYDPRVAIAWVMSLVCARGIKKCGL